jgi:hypothetical protein
MASSAVQSPTGLHAAPGRSEAEAAIREAIALGQPGCAVVLLADRVLAVCDESGYAAGERLLDAFYARWRAALGTSTRLYRWSFSSFVAAPMWGEAAFSIERLASELTVCRLGDGRHIATGARVHIVPLHWGETAEMVSRLLDQFVAAYAG